MALDYLVGSAHVPQGEEYDLAIAMLEAATDRRTVTTARALGGNRHYRDGLGNPGTACVLYRRRWGDAGDDEYVTLEVKGSVFMGQEPEWGASLVRELVVLGCSFSRLDVAGDLAPGVLTVRELQRAADEGGLVTRARYRSATTTVANGAESRTLYVGSPTSVRRVRAYDKRGPVRIEAQLRDEAVPGSVAALVGGAALGDVWSREVLRTVDFPAVPAFVAALRGGGGAHPAEGYRGPRKGRRAAVGAGSGSSVVNLAR